VLQRHDPWWWNLCNNNSNYQKLGQQHHEKEKKDCLNMDIDVCCHSDRPDDAFGYYVKSFKEKGMINSYFHPQVPLLHLHLILCCTVGIFLHETQTVSLTWNKCFMLSLRSPLAGQWQNW
jgi:hypothetical protein